MDLGIDDLFVLNILLIDILINHFDKVLILCLKISKGTLLAKAIQGE